MELTFETSTYEGWTVVAVHGELDLHTSPSLRDALGRAIDDGAGWLALDLADVPFMDSSSLGVLVGALKRLREKGGEMALVGVQGSPSKVVSLTGLDSVFRVVPDLASLPTP
jgi:anti-sigma B factor antagonist